MEFMYYSSNLFKYVDREMVPIFYNIYNMECVHKNSIKNTTIHMLGQTTRLLVKIALSILYQTNLRTQKSNVHLIAYLITNYGNNQYVAEIALLYTIKDLLK